MMDKINLEELKERPRLLMGIGAVVVIGVLGVISVIGVAVVLVLGKDWPDCPFGAEMVEKEAHGHVVERYCEIEDDTGDIVIHGDYEQYNTSGDPIREVEFEYGAKVGTELRWHDNGERKSEIPYRNGQRHGKAVFWTDDGDVSIEAEYRRGEFSGEVVGWYIQGSEPEKMVEAFYEEGALEGEAKLHGLRSGDPSLEVHFEAGEPASPASLRVGTLSVKSEDDIVAGLQNPDNYRVARLNSRPVMACEEEFRDWALSDEDDGFWLAPHCRVVADILFDLDVDRAATAFRTILDDEDEE